MARLYCIPASLGTRADSAHSRARTFPVLDPGALVPTVMRSGGGDNDDKRHQTQLPHTLPQLQPTHAARTPALAAQALPFSSRGPLPETWTSGSHYEDGLHRWEEPAETLKKWPTSSSAAGVSRSCWINGGRDLPPLHRHHGWHHSGGQGRADRRHGCNFCGRACLSASHSSF